MNKRPALLSAIGLTFVLLAILGISLTAQAAPDKNIPARPQTILLADDFDYGTTAGNLVAVSAGNWISHSGTSGPVGYIPTGLSMSGYGSSGVGGAATISTTGAEDVNRRFITQTSGTVYFSALVNVSTAAVTGTYFLHLNNSNTSFHARIFARDDLGVLRFGLSDSSTGSYASASFSFSTTYLIVAKYNVGTGASALYVLDTVVSTEPATALITATGTAQSVLAVAMRQSNVTSPPASVAATPSAIIDGVRVATTWADVVGYVPPPEANLGVAKTGPATASAGDAITYTINLSNTGSIAATSTVVTDTLPTEVSFVTYTTALTASFSQPDARTLVWDLGDVASGVNGLITVQGTISSGVSSGTVFTNSVTASTTATETNTANNTATATTLIGAPDLVVVKTGPVTVNAGDLVAYTLTYSNTGDLTATGVTLVDRLPTGLSYVTDSLGTGMQAGNTISWPLASLANNALGSVVLTATANYVGDQVNVATISGSPTDSNPLDNVSVITTTVLGSDPFVSKTGSTAAFNGELITYTVIYGNHGSVATDVILTDTLPISFTTANIAYDNSNLTPIDGTGTRSWTRTLAAGDRFTFTLALTVPTSIASNTHITNTIQIAGSSLGNNPIDDLSLATGTVYQIVPIATARAGSNGQVFAVEGNVTVVPATFSAGEWELQDETGGITAFYTPAPTVTLGDRVRLVGVFDNSFGAQPELSSPLYFAKLGPGIPPAPKLYTTGQVVAGSSQGWLVTISGTLSSLTNCSGNYHLAVNDGSGAADVFINAYSNPVINPCGRGFANGDWVRVTGFSTVFSPTYEVRPRMASDLLQYPRVLSVSPAPAATGVAVTAPITAAFNLTMTNVNNTTFLLQGPGGAVTGMVTYDPASKVATFTPEANLAFGTTYTATLKSGLQASNGLTLMPAQDVSWTFTTLQPVPNLSTSTKTNSVNGVVRSGEWVTYTITLNNTGSANATVVVTDVLGTYYSVARLLDFTQPTTGTLTWTGIVTAGQSVNVRFVAQVKGLQSLPIGVSLLFNSAQMNDNVNPPFSIDDQTPPMITVHGLYLPLIRR